MVLLDFRIKGDGREEGGGDYVHPTLQVNIPMRLQGLMRCMRPESLMG